MLVVLKTMKAGLTTIISGLKKGKTARDVRLVNKNESLK